MLFNCDSKPEVAAPQPHCMYMESLMSMEMVQEASLFPVDPGEACRMVDMDYEMDAEDLSSSNSHSEDNTNPEEPIMNKTDTASNNIRSLGRTDEVLETMESQMAPLEKVSSAKEVDTDEKPEAVMMNFIEDELTASEKVENPADLSPEQLYDNISEKSSQSSLTGCSISSSSSAQNTPATSRPETPLVENLVENYVHHPVESMQQEHFLERLNLITPATLKYNKENKKVERRRRITANPKYNRNGFIDLSHMGKRNRKHEEALEAMQRSLAAPISPVVPKVLGNCVVCESSGGDLTCETCKMKVHSDCIKVSGTKAPVPIRLPKCPDCITAANVALWEPELQHYLIASSTISAAIKRKRPTKHKKPKKPKRDSPQKHAVPERQAVVSPGAGASTSGETTRLKPILSKPITAEKSGASNAVSPAKTTPKKKSKVNGVKAKTLLVTGNIGADNSTNPVQPARPVILTEAGSDMAAPPRVKPPPIRSVNRLPKQTVSPISVERTIMAMTSAARSVMLSYGLPKVLSAATSSSSENIPGTTVTVTTSTIPNDQVLPKAEVPSSDFTANVTNHENIAPAVTCVPPPVEIN